MLGVAVVAVAVVTLLFNLAGAILSAVLIGMMTGASRRWNWGAIPVSLVPPVVVLVLGRVAKISIESHQSLLLALLCLGAFWGTAIATALLMRLEKRPEAAPGFEAAAKPVESHAEFRPEQLDGTWLMQATAGGSCSSRRTLTIESGHFTLRGGDNAGAGGIIAEGSIVARGDGAAETMRERDAGQPSSPSS
jgi:hypothetical protein